MRISMTILLLIALVLLIGCINGPDPELQKRLDALTQQSIQAKADIAAALDAIKNNGLTPDTLQKFIEASSSSNNIYQQIMNIQKEMTQNSSGTNWLYIIVSIISGLTGYPLMRTLRLNYSNSALNVQDGSKTG